MSHPSKRRGYEGEVRALSELVLLFPRLKRTGSVNYTLHAPDLEQLALPDRDYPMVRIVALATDHKKTLYCLTAEDLERLVTFHGRTDTLPVTVQVKKRAKPSFAHTVMAGLVGATK